jgi:ParB-like chromosome segregation protein Spo0J
MEHAVAYKPNRLGAQQRRTGTPKLQIHPVAELFPDLTAAELAELAADIKANGLRHPIVCTKDELILDGRTRLKACKIAGVEPFFEIYRGDDPSVTSSVPTCDGAI